MTKHQQNYVMQHARARHNDRIIPGCAGTPEMVVMTAQNACRAIDKDSQEQLIVATLVMIFASCKFWKRWDTWAFTMKQWRVIEAVLATEEITSAQIGVLAGVRT